MTRLFIFIFPLFLFAQEKNEIYSIFYNVENLFDTIDNPKTNDNEFLPISKKKWNTERYVNKLEKLSKVFASSFEGKIPHIIGLCEVENSLVVEDLLNQDFFQNHNYFLIHKQSPDFRGIDCALLVDTNKMSLISYDFIEVLIPGSNRPTRDIVYAKVMIDSEYFNIFVNHWPSRYGGVEKSEHKRIAAAVSLRNYIDKNIDSDEKIIIMGDLNDYPKNKSIKDFLVLEDLFNLMINSKEKGSYNYKGFWGFIDHIIISKNLLFNDNNDKKGYCVFDFGVISEKWMLFSDSKGNQKPNRTYLGSKWVGGISDHLPVYLILRN